MKITKKQLKQFFDIFSPYGYDYTGQTKKQMLEEFKHQKSFCDKHGILSFNLALKQIIGGIEWLQGKILKKY